MANNYIQFAVEFPFPEQAAQDFMALCGGDLAVAFPQWFKDKHGITEDNAEDLEDFGVITEYNDGKLYIASEEYGDIDGVAFMLSEVMEQYNIRKGVVIEVAFTCSRFRIHEFGGTVVVIGPDGCKFKSTHECGQELLSEMGLEDINNE